MTSYDKFNILLKIGQAIEIKAQQKILSYYDNKYTITEICNNYRYDFMLSNGDAYEIKFDRLACKTNNIFVEVIQFNKNSGLLTTKAKYYVFVIENLNKNLFTTQESNLLYYRIKVKKLKKLIKKQLYFKVYHDNDKTGYLFNLPLIVSHSKQL
jgi:hypothetical protein